MIDRNLNYGRQHISRFLEMATGAKNILDLGAGTGIDLDAAKRIHPEATLYALEAYPPYQEILKSKGVSVFSANIERDVFPFEDGSFDVIICNQILEHCKEIWWILHEISRVLKRGGTLIVGVPNLASLHNRILLSIGRQPTAIQNNSAHVRGYTKPDFIKFLQTGFRDGYALKDSGGSNFYPFPPVIANVLASLFPSMAWGMFLMLQKNRDYTDGFVRSPIENQLETNFHLGEK